MVKKGELVLVVHEGRFVYVPRRSCKGKHWIDLLDHSLGVTDGIIFLERADWTGDLVPEREFRGLGSVPEFGVRYENSLILYEFCTYDNFQRRKVESKVLQYKRNLTEIEAKFGRTAIVLFVIDATKSDIERIQSRADFCFLVDYQTFRATAIGQHLSAPIYLWEDGNYYPLRS